MYVDRLISHLTGNGVFAVGLTLAVVGLTSLHQLLYSSFQVGRQLLRPGHGPTTLLLVVALRGEEEREGGREEGKKGGREGGR